MINIIGIDFQKLHDVILKHGGYSTIEYLIMNSETLQAISKALPESIKYTLRRDFKNAIDYSIITYKEIPIAICEKLDFGEVKIV